MNVKHKCWTEREDSALKIAYEEWIGKKNNWSKIVKDLHARGELLHKTSEQTRERYTELSKRIKTQTKDNYYGPNAIKNFFLKKETKNTPSQLLDESPNAEEIEKKVTALIEKLTFPPPPSPPENLTSKKRKASETPTSSNTPSDFDEALPYSGSSAYTFQSTPSISISSDETALDQCLPEGWESSFQNYENIPMYFEEYKGFSSMNRDKFGK